LSYSTFEYSNLKVSEVGNGLVNITVDVTNSGNREGQEVVQIYMSDLVASKTRPVKELKRFKKVSISAHSTFTANFQLTKEDFGFYNDQMKLTIEPGDFEISAGGNSNANLVVKYLLK